MTEPTRGKILMFTRGLTGALNHSLELARRLRLHGFEVAIAGPERAEAAVTRNGVRFVLLDADEKAKKEYRQLADSGRFRAAWRGWRLRQQLDGLDQIRNLVQLEAPNVVVAEVETHVAIIALHRLEVPVVLLSPWFAIERDHRFPPMHTSVGIGQPGAWVKGIAAWAQVLGERVLRQQVKDRFRPSSVLQRWTTPVSFLTVQRRDLARIARRQGFSLREITCTTDWLHPHSYTHLPMMSAALPDFDFPTRTRSGHIFVGPLISTDRVDAPPEVYEQLDEFAASAREDGRRIVYCAVGTRSKITAAIVTRVLTACQMQDYSVILGLGGNVPEGAELLADNALILEYAPQLEALSLADVAVIHGGIGSIHECLANAVPMLVHSGGDGDQPGCAVRVEHHGLGLRLDLTAASTGQIAAALDRAFSDLDMQQRLAVAADRIAEVTKEDPAVALVTSMALGSKAGY